MKENFCKWYDKPLKDVCESEQDACARAGWDCLTCLCLTEQDNNDKTEG